MLDWNTVFDSKLLWTYVHLDMCAYIVIWQLMGAEIAKDSCRFTLIYINLRWFTLIYVDLHRFTSIYVDLRQDNSRKLSFSK